MCVRKRDYKLTSHISKLMIGCERKKKRRRWLVQLKIRKSNMLGHRDWHTMSPHTIGVTAFSVLTTSRRGSSLFTANKLHKEGGKKEMVGKTIDCQKTKKEDHNDKQNEQVLLSICSFRWNKHKHLKQIFLCVYMYIFKHVCMCMQMHMCAHTHNKWFSLECDMLNNTQNWKEHNTWQQPKWNLCYIAHKLITIQYSAAR